MTRRGGLRSHRRAARVVDGLRAWVDREIPKEYALELERSDDEYSFALWDTLARPGLHGTGVPKQYGGRGADNVTQMLLARELGRSLAGLLWVWGSTSFAGTQSLSLHGTEEQKARFLPAIARGELRCTIGFTESGGGTDLLGGLRTTGRRVDGG